MTSTWEWIKEVVTQLETLLSSLEDDQGNKIFKEIVVGWKKSPKHWPCALILPSEDLLSIPTVKHDYHRLRIIICVVSEKVTVRGSLLSAIELAGRVHDALVSDRTLNGTVDNLEVLRYDYMWPRVREYRREYIALVTEYRRIL